MPCTTRAPNLRPGMRRRVCSRKISTAKDDLTGGSTTRGFARPQRATQYIDMICPTVPVDGLALSVNPGHTTRGAICAGSEDSEARSPDRADRHVSSRREPYIIGAPCGHRGCRELARHDRTRSELFDQNAVQEPRRVPDCAGICLVCALRRGFSIRERKRPRA